MTFTESAEGLVYTERPLSAAPRLLAAFFGMAMFLVPYPFLLHGSWQSFTLSTVVASLCVVLPPIAGVFFIGIALVPAQRVVFDAGHRQLRRTARGPLGRRREAIGFDRIERVEVVRHKGIDDPDVFELVLALRGRRPLKLGAYDSAAEAELWQRRLQGMMVPA